jgi:hypothetical protein
VCGGRFLTIEIIVELSGTAAAFCRSGAQAFATSHISQRNAGKIGAPLHGSDKFSARGYEPERLTACQLSSIAAARYEIAPARAFAARTLHFLFIELRDIRAENSVWGHDAVRPRSSVATTSAGP